MKHAASSAGPPSAQPAVRFEGICRSFHGVTVLREVTFDVPPSNVLGLVGGNGAGKSTLMNLLGGNLKPDSGRMFVDGMRYQPRHSGEARSAGVAFVHQELNLFPNLSIAENLHLNAFPRRAGPFWIHRPRMRGRTASLLAQVGLSCPPDTAVGRLSTGEQQLVEIARALGQNARVLILDEPTTSLSTRECQRLFQLIPELKCRGLSIIYISHALEDVLRLSDEVVVLRDGRVVARHPASELDPERLVSLMVGRQVNPFRPTGLDRGVGGTILELRNVTRPGVVEAISFKLERGEVLGLSGLMGAGRSELARILFGLDSFRSGEIRLEGRPLTGGPRRRIQSGLAFVTEDRRQEGLCMDASVADNIALVKLPDFCRGPLGWVNSEAMCAAVEGIRQGVAMSLFRDSQPVRTLSGGNQQKVVLAKWLLNEPRMLILDEPTRGIDVAARFEIYELIRRLAGRGAGILLISSEIEELTAVCDRILVMRQGVLAAEFPRSEFNPQRILAASFHESRTR